MLLQVIRIKKIIVFQKLLFFLLLLTHFQCINSKHNFKIDRQETFFNNLGAEPENLHPIKSTDHYSRVIQSHILESLLVRNDDTYEWEPSLAKKWSVSPDGKIMTFEIFDNLQWSDGKPLTAQDIKFSFSAYTDPAYGGISSLPYFEKIKSAAVLSDTKIQFEVKEPYFGNFQVIVYMMKVIPEHIYKDPKLKLSKTVIGSGPYMISHYVKRKILVLKKNPLWKGVENKTDRKRFQFPSIAFRFVLDPADILLRMEKEHLDFTRLSSEEYMSKTNKPPWGAKIKKVEYSNKDPKGYSYIGFNLKRELFKDPRVRKALAHLLNRELINEKFYYNKAELARGPWYFWSDYADPAVSPILFDPKEAKKLLRQAGWTDKDQNGFLEKNINGVKKELKFTLMFSSGSQGEKYLTLYQEELKKAGIKMELKVLDWISFVRLIDDKNFDAVVLGWTAGFSIDLDPKQIWHSSSSQKGGSNYIGYSNPEVDALIDRGRSQFNKRERIKYFKKVYRLIAADVPYIFLFTLRQRFYGVNDRIETYRPSWNYSIGLFYWTFKNPN